MMDSEQFCMAASWIVALVVCFVSIACLQGIGVSIFIGFPIAVLLAFVCFQIAYLHMAWWLMRDDDDGE